MKTPEERSLTIKKREAEHLAELELARQVLHDYEPLFVIVFGALGLGLLENTRWGDKQYQLISTHQKQALLAGIVAIEIARSGLVGQVSTAGTSILHSVGDLAPVMGSLLAAAA